MGSCLSSPAPPSTLHAASSAPTAKVLMLSGALAEFSSPAVTASLVIPPGCFLCDSDELQIDIPAPPLPPDRPLTAGRLYFVIPDHMRGAPLQGAFMAELAVNATAALAKAGAAGHGIEGSRYRKKRNKWLQLVMPVFEEAGHRWCCTSPPDRNKMVVKQEPGMREDVTPNDSTAPKKSDEPPPRLLRKGSIRDRLVRRLSGRSRLTPIEEAVE